MGLLKSIFGATPISGIIDGVGGILDKFITSPSDKKEFELALEALLQKRDAELETTFRAELGAKERVLVAELTQGDTYTKRARPTVVYFGLFLFLFNYSIVPLFGFPQLDLPAEFMYGWSGIVATWSIGRSAERIGGRNRTTGLITGSKEPTTRLGL